ncbi:hypothetical protein EGW08_018427 [Elysia chlorotica]|uniref:Dr1-associated corepressor n=1 Tax=Elysia chlorotica TaxID=188477 RepID=A0A3S1B311_ELYCH|nr:hypothetical protein EGW08_018427 [Elysia chlorotica]
MPKTPSRMSKKKKYNSRFPPARIKKIMQTDEDVGKVAATVPIIISRALELFIESLITETSKATIAKNAKTLSTSHIKQTIHSNKQFDFLRDLVANIPDHNTAEDNNGNANGNGTSDAPQDNGDIPQKKKRGRPRKIKEAPVPNRKKQGGSSKVSPETSEEEDEEEEEDEDEDTESDDGGKTPKPPVTLTNHFSKSLPSSSTSSISYVATHQNSGGVVDINGPQNYPTHILFFTPCISFPPGYTVPALASLTNQQQQLQLPQQMMAHQQSLQQQQHNMGSNIPSSVAPSLSHPYLPSAAFPNHQPPPNFTNNALPSGSLEGYPIPPQFHHSHSPYHHPMPTPMMPPAHHQSAPMQLPQGGPGYPSMAHMPAATTVHVPASVSHSQQAQPINLSMSSQRRPHTRDDEADDYDS